MAKIMKLHERDGAAGVFDDPLLQRMLGCEDGENGLRKAESKDIPVSACIPWYDDENSTQPFRMYPKAKLEELALDMDARGLDNPIIVRPLGTGYQILAGHNRVEAAKLIGWVTIQAKIVNADDDAARLILVNTNLLQRDKILPSERAKAYKIQLDAMKRQGQRTDLTSGQIVQKLSVEVVAEKSGENYKQIQRYIRLNELDPALLDMVDADQLPFTCGVSLSYLSPDTQQLLLDTMNEHNIATVNGKQADLIKAQADTLDSAVLCEIFGITDNGETPHKKSPKPITIKIPAELWGNLSPKLAKDEALIRRIVEDSKKYAEELKCQK